MGSLITLLRRDGFSPADAPGLQLWLRADAGVTTDGAAQFTAASNRYLSSPDTASLSTGDVDYAFALWVYLDTKTAEQYIVSKYDGGASGAEYNLRYGPGPDRFLFTVLDGAAGAVGNVSAGNLGSPAAGVWYFIVCWHSATLNQVGIQVNNGVANTVATTGPAGDSASTFRVGTVLPAIASPLNGRVDSLAFFKNTILSAGERTALFNGGAGRTYSSLTSAEKTNLVSWWDLDELSGTRYDSHGGQHLTAHNGVTTATGIASGAATDGDPVKQWADQSGAGRHAVQATASKKPTYQAAGLLGRPALRFDSVDDFLSCGDVTFLDGLSAFTLFAVSRTAVAADQSIVAKQYGGTALDLRFTSGGKLTAEAAGGAAVTGATAVNDGAARVVTAVYDGANLTTFLNGVQEAQAARTGAVANTADVLAVGARSNGSLATYHHGGDIAEVLVYAGALSAADRSRVEAYLKRRYGL